MPAPRNHRFAGDRLGGAVGAHGTDPADLIAGPDTGPDLSRLTRLLPEWQRRAACIGEPLATFFIERGAQAGPAKQICSGCPVLEECREWAVADSSLTHGVIGGLSPKERIAERARRARERAA